MASSFPTVLLLLLPILLHHTSTACHVDDESALLSFKSGFTQDPSGLLSSWVPTTDCCTWDGVLCEANTRRVNILMVFEKSNDPKSPISGTISTSVAKLQYLNGIFIQSCPNITGPFPIFLSSLPDLVWLFLDNNGLSGPIPSDIGTRFPKLQILNLSGNRFTGSIPRSVGLITDLVDLSLEGNQLTGPIPKEIGRLKKLTRLPLAKNQLSGKIPDFFDSFTNLNYLSLSYNKFSGEIPSSMSYLASSLTYLELGHNMLTGKIPDYVGNFHALQELDLSANQLTGTVPSTFRNLTGLSKLNLAHNMLVDPFPELNVEWVESFDLSYNKFNLGQIPKWVSTARVVSSIKLAKCGLKFKFDTLKLKLRYYRYIDLSENQISGSPIRFFNHNPIVKEFLTSGNQLRFNISELVIPTYLNYLNLSRNQVYGKVPASIARLENVDLSHNHLCGRIPKTNFSAKAFEGNDCLCGSPLPSCEK